MKLKMPLVSDYENIKTGDMPGDKIEISEKHIKNVETILPKLDMLLKDGKTVISVHGGSGVGKSETASILAYVLEQNGLNTYIMSGDNYPRRIPKNNDPERIRVFRECALKGLVASGEYTKKNRDIIFNLRDTDEDLNSDLTVMYPFLEPYIKAGTEGLRNYLGTKNEIDFDEVNSKLKEFKSGKQAILLKRMGRTEDEMYYDEIDFSATDVLILEWTHGNSVNLEGVDIPILLNSTPEETMAHRKSRNRDGKVDSPFVKIVLEIEQKKIYDQAKNAKIIITKSGEYINYEDYLELMGEMK